ncbi:MAG: ATP-binding cassette domain-containing protein, partial [Acidimicrobiales bacterium]
MERGRSGPPAVTSAAVDPEAERHPSTLAPASARYAALHVSKAFNGAPVLRDVSILLEPGQVHALVGENGAGKSTLFKIMSGMYQPDTGELVLAGERLADLTPRMALHEGIYLVPQEPTLMQHLSAAENLYVGALPRRRVPGLVDWARVRGEAATFFGRVGLDIDVQTPARLLSIAQQQLLECARALVHNCRVILFDEPTSPLTSHETEILFRLMDALRADGLALGFISHRLDEIIEVGDRVTVLRDGAMVSTAERGGCSRNDIVTAMIGRPLGVGARG